jgi:hypothetical protein
MNLRRSPLETSRERSHNSVLNLSKVGTKTKDPAEENLTESVQRHL